MIEASPIVVTDLPDVALSEGPATACAHKRRHPAPQNPGPAVVGVGPRGGSGGGGGSPPAVYGRSNTSLAAGGGGDLISKSEQRWWVHGWPCRYSSSSHLRFSSILLTYSTGEGKISPPLKSPKLQVPYAQMTAITQQDIPQTETPKLQHIATTKRASTSSTRFHTSAQETVGSGASVSAWLFLENTILLQRWRKMELFHQNFAGGNCATFLDGGSFPPPVHDCQLAPRLLPHIETIMCYDVSRQTEGQRKAGANVSVRRQASTAGAGPHLPKQWHAPRASGREGGAGTDLDTTLLLRSGNVTRSASTGSALGALRTGHRIDGGHPHVPLGLPGPGDPVPRQRSPSVGPVHWVPGPTSRGRGIHTFGFKGRGGGGGGFGLVWPAPAPWPKAWGAKELYPRSHLSHPAITSTWGLPMPRFVPPGFGTRRESIQRSLACSSVVQPLDQPFHVGGGGVADALRPPPPQQLGPARTGAPPLCLLSTGIGPPPWPAKNSLGGWGVGRRPWSPFSNPPPPLEGAPRGLHIFHAFFKSLVSHITWQSCLATCWSH